MQVTRALIWEFFARGRVPLLSAAAGALTLTCAVLGVLAAISNFSPVGSEVGAQLHFGMYWSVLFVLGAAVISAAGSPRCRFSLPASSWQIVACVMGCSATITFALYVLLALVLNAILRAGWPIWGPGLLAAVIVSWFFAVIWSTSHSQFMQLLAGVASFLGLITLIAAATPATPDLGRLTALNTRSVLGFVTAIAVSGIVGTWGFANLRRGGGFDPQQLADWVVNRLPLPFANTRLRSPRSAQFWFEWTERGYVLPAMTTVLCVAILAIILYQRPGSEVASAVFGGSIAVLVSILTVIGMYLGGRSRFGGFGAFGGTRPLTDQAIAAAVLKSAACAVALSAFIWLATLATSFLLIGVTRPYLISMAGGSGMGTVILIVLSCVATAWTLVGIVTSLTLAGTRVLALTFWILLGAVLVGAMTPGLLPREAALVFTRAYTMLSFSILVAILTGVYFVSWRQNLISTYVLFVPIGLIAILLVAVHFSGRPVEAVSILPMLCLGLLPALPLAAAPLAVRWNRHR